MKRFALLAGAVLAASVPALVLVARPAAAAEVAYSAGTSTQAGAGHVRCSSTFEAVPWVSGETMSARCYFSGLVPTGATPATHIGDDLPLWEPGTAGYAVKGVTGYYKRSDTANYANFQLYVNTAGTAFGSTTQTSSASVFGGTCNALRGDGSPAAPSKSVQIACTANASQNAVAPIRPHSSDTARFMASNIEFGYYTAGGSPTTPPTGWPAVPLAYYSKNYASSAAPTGFPDSGSGEYWNTGTTGSWPDDWFPGGDSPGEAGAHGLECDANTFKDDEGSWWVSLAAHNLDEPVNGAGVQKAWMGSWDTEGGLVGQTTTTDPDNRLTVPLPSPNARPDWGWIAQFHTRVKLPAAVYAPPVEDDPGTDDDGKWVEDDNGLWWWVAAPFAIEWAKFAGTEWAGYATVASTGGTGALAAYPAVAAGTAALSYYGTTKLLEAWDPFSWEDDEDTELGDAAKGYSPNGARFVNGVTPAGPTDLYTEYELTCSVRVKPGSSDHETVDPPGDSGGGERDGETSGDGECGGNRFGWIPWVGSWVSGFTTLACIIARAFGLLLDGLWNLLVPSDFDFSPITDEIETGFPMNIVAGLVEIVTTVVGTLTTAVDEGDPCFSLPVGQVIDDGVGGVGFSAETSEYASAGYAFPTPSSAGCAAPGGDEDLAELGDLFGWADDLRQAQEWVLYAGVTFAVIRAAKNEDDEELGSAL